MEECWRLSVWNKEKKVGWWGWVLFHFCHSNHGWRKNKSWNRPWCRLLVAQEIGCFLPAGFHDGNCTYSIGQRLMIEYCERPCQDWVSIYYIIYIYIISYSESCKHLVWLVCVWFPVFSLELWVDGELVLYSDRRSALNLQFSHRSWLAGELLCDVKA